MRSFTLVNSLVLLGYFGLVSSNTPVCGAGQYYANSKCNYCAPGTYQSDSQNPHTSCSTVQAGDYACGSVTVGGVKCYGATAQQMCAAGTYSAGGTVSQCTTCSPGYKCPGTGQNIQQPCSPGEYVPTSGYTGQDCLACPAGTFNNVNAATSCCKCCAGTFNNIVHQTHCFACSEQTNPMKDYSPVGATDVSQCQAQPIKGVTNAPSCSNTMTNSPGQAYCPPEQGNSPNPNPSSINKRRVAAAKCPGGLKRCPHYAGLGGFECVDTQSDPESCGGCLGFDAESDGVDCTAIPYVNRVSCRRGHCVIQACSKGFHKGQNGKSCEPLPHTLQAQHREARYRATHHAINPGPVQGRAAISIPKHRHHNHKHHHEHEGI